MDEIQKEAAAVAPVSAPLQSEAVQELQKFAVANFGKLDLDHDLFISKEELQKTAASGTFQGREAQYVEALAQQVDNIAKLHDDGWFTASKGISLNDLVQLDHLRERRNNEVATAQTVGTFGLQNFDKLDFDKRGLLHGYELVSLNGEGCYSPQKKAIISQMKEEDRKMFAFLKTHMDQIGHPQQVPVWICKPYQYTTQYGISKAELASYPQRVAQSERYTLINDIDKTLSR